jgi:F0F1-type ATP synthase assembly protein I
MFIWGLFKYFILGGGDEDSRKEGRQLMLYSILAFFLMVTIFAIVDLLATGLGFSEGGETIMVPNIFTR